METRKALRHAMKFARAFTVGLLDETPEAHWLHQPTPDANHILWNVGHLGVSHHWARRQIDASVEPTDEAWRALFAQNSSPTADARAYPPVTEVRAYYDRQWDQLIDMIEAISDEELAAAAPEEATYLAKDKLGLFHFVPWHEGIHTGEIAAVRKSLKLGKKFA